MERIGKERELNHCRQREGEEKKKKSF